MKLSHYNLEKSVQSVLPTGLRMGPISRQCISDCWANQDSHMKHTQLWDNDSDCPAWMNTKVKDSLVYSTQAVGRPHSTAVKPSRRVCSYYEPYGLHRLLKKKDLSAFIGSIYKEYPRILPHRVTMRSESVPFYLYLNPATPFSPRTPASLCMV